MVFGVFMMDSDYYRRLNLEKLVLEDKEWIVYIEALSYCKNNNTDSIGPYRLHGNSVKAGGYLADRLKPPKECSFGGGSFDTIKKQGIKMKFFRQRKKKIDEKPGTRRPIYVDCEKIENGLEDLRANHAKYKDKIFVAKPREIDEKPIIVYDMVSCIKNPKVYEELSPRGPHTIVRKVARISS